MPEDKLQELLLELQDELSIIAQQSDKRNTNLQVQMDDCVEEVDKRIKKRWNWLLGIILAAGVATGVLGFEVWERQYDRVNELHEHVIRMEQKIEFLKELTLKKHDLYDKMEMLRKEREAALDKLVKELKEEIDKLHPRRKK